jgi:hypothetical protein
LDPASVPDNQLLGKLSRRDRKRMIDGCDRVDLVLGATFCGSDQPLRHVYFPITGFISMIAIVGQHPPLEMGLHLREFPRGGAAVGALVTHDA